MSRMLWNRERESLAIGEWLWLWLQTRERSGGWHSGKRRGKWKVFLRRGKRRGTGNGRRCSNLRSGMGERGWWKLPR